MRDLRRGHGTPSAGSGTIGFYRGKTFPERIFKNFLKSSEKPPFLFFKQLNLLMFF